MTCCEAGGTVWWYDNKEPLRCSRTWARCVLQRYLSGEKRYEKIARTHHAGIVSVLFPLCLRPSFCRGRIACEEQQGWKWETPSWKKQQDESNWWAWNDISSLNVWPTVSVFGLWKTDGCEERGRTDEGGGRKKWNNLARRNKISDKGNGGEKEIACDTQRKDEEKHWTRHKGEMGQRADIWLNGWIYPADIGRSWQCYCCSACFLP
jgi:hypothetical protein